ncbi:hypothetical protein MHN81_22900 [Pseudoalteromonas sp. Of7M-16]|nr:hypothetical protein [Pseudoalteromonas sp. Of7M-16]
MFQCPPRGSVERIWGSDIYTSSSRICTAAVHAGKINARDGGVVTIRIKQGEEKYTGSKRNGVESNKRTRKYHSSYIFL